ncbi:DUF4369 domain-containing protein [Flagellimonas algicola]|uniref:DUF4369 domain-containing protein n=1 Tax=Flagellimonas algicola TaxID=2583815 RepID=A0ABY2WG92_9FLAO|nr:DUF4369 domain-containing protein [Allomuricauda algicola]TMU50567.1 DUF4369 domain-containing protein [Allomuricauda algicola]
MKRILSVLTLLVLLISCASKTENTMTVSGNIKGLKKGTLYLQHFKDSNLVVLDSVEIQGDGNFVFAHELEEPDVFYLYLNKQDNNELNDRITFFGESGNITINTNWNTFDLNPEISGSNSNKKLEEFNSMMSQFGIRELELFQLVAQPEFQEDSLKQDSIQRLIDRNVLGTYRYALNFGLINGDSYVTPYLMTTVADVVNPIYLDSVYKVLEPNVASSKYGKILRAQLDGQ